jgi:peptide deformylase
MTIMKLVLAPDPLLKKKSLPVVEVDDQIRKLMDDMYETMKKENGLGLAAVQVGVLKRIIVIEIEEEHEIANPLFIANPEIISYSKEFSTYNEGCLSFPEQRLEIQRSAMIVLKYLDYNNQIQEIKAEGLLATAIQHEIDHTNGVVIADHASVLKKSMMMKKAKKIKEDLQ